MLIQFFLHIYLLNPEIICDLARLASVEVVQIGLQLCNSTIPDSTAKVFALVAHAVIFFPVILIGIALAFREGISLTQIEATSERLKESVDQS